MKKITVPLILKHKYSVFFLNYTNRLNFFKIKSILSVKYNNFCVNSQKNIFR